MEQNDNELTGKEFSDLMKSILKPEVVNETNGWVLDLRNERVVYATIISTSGAEYNWYCPETKNYLTDLDVFESEQIATEYYLGLVIKDKKETMLWFHQLESKLIDKLSQFIEVSA